MDTTATYPNRVRDMVDQEGDVGFPEFPMSIIDVYTKSGLLVSHGYHRVVYGDHGPYIEMHNSQVIWDNFSCTRKGVGYYDKWYSADGVMLYDQLKTVANLPNPPSGRFSFRGNRKEGYADYRVGMVYVDPYACVMRLNN